jgi:hypothetical protein
MAWTEITDTDIMRQQPAATYNFTASGTIYKGQGVYLCADNKVKVPTDATSYGIGVAMNDASDGEEIAVHGIGCICLTRLSGAAGGYTAGTPVGVLIDGKWGTDNSTNETAVVIQKTTATNGTGLIMIVGGSTT